MTQMKRVKTIWSWENELEIKNEGKKKTSEIIRAELVPAGGVPNCGREGLGYSYK